MTRVAVVGGGVAGCAAALAARRAGASVVLMSQGPGASALYAGGMEICGDLVGLAGREPYHPFARLGLDHHQLGDLLDQACQQFQALLSQAGLQLRGDWRQQGRYVDAKGSVRPAHLVPEAVAGGELGHLRGRRVGVAEISNVTEYDAAVVAQTLIDEAGARATPIPMELDLPSAASLTDLYGRTAPVIQTEVDVMAYPPGMRDLPPHAFELLAGIPSAHGWRLQAALENALAQAGVETQRRTVTRVATQGQRVLAVEDEAVDELVLAGGRYIGGGLVRSGAVREPLLDLGVFYEGERVDEAYPSRLHHLEYLSPEPAFKAGLLTDIALRPLAWDQSLPYQNLRAAGAVLGGYDYARECGFGVPVLTGWLAGTWAAR
jgi:glycerol-3-phosphate dehydrogenase subunit B